MDTTYLILGINHKKASLELREKINIPQSLIPRVQNEIQLLLKSNKSEQIILSTCNRTEFYFSGVISQDDLEALMDWISDFSKEEKENLMKFTYLLKGDDAVAHIFRLACGLDSMAIGEPQILGQLKSATKLAKVSGFLGNELDQLTQRAFNVAKIVRSKTDIGKQSISLAVLSIQLAKRIFGNLSNCRVLFIGAGEMIRLCLNHVKEQNPRSISLTNRDAERGRSLAEEFGGDYFPLSSLNAELSKYDIVYSCTASSLPLIGVGTISTALKKRKNYPIVCIDLAVPRDIEPEVKKLDNIFLFSIDDLGAQVDENLKTRMSSVTEAEEIIKENIIGFFNWKKNRENIPLITRIQDRGDSIKKLEIKLAKKRLENGISIEEVLDGLAKGITNKFLHNAYKTLNSNTSEEQEITEMWIKKIYGIDSNNE